MSSLQKLMNDYLKKSEMADLLKRLEKVENKSKEAFDLSKKNEVKVKKWKPSWK